ncbi:MAG: ATP-dependent Clp protease proteolytic subunit [Deltaproteobacteria bacterium]|nr:ATP-dependent Clp protease proteolytic subunit [Deltaproteobacteria bacterium]
MYLKDMKLFQVRGILISEAVDSSTAERVVRDLLILDEENKEPIKIYINSPGGEVNSGFAIFDTIRFIDSEVKVVNIGLCASIATIINIAAKKENRFAMPNSKFLIHQPLISGQVIGPASDIEITANQILKTRERLNQLLAEECGQDLKKVEEDTVRDYWMTAPEACDYGLVTRVVRSKKEIQ